MRQRERIKFRHWDNSFPTPTILCIYDKPTNAKIVNQWDRQRLFFLFIIRSHYRFFLLLLLGAFKDELDKYLSEMTYLWHRRMNYQLFRIS